MKAEPAHHLGIAAVLILSACDKPAPPAVAVPWPVGAAPRMTITTASVPAGHELDGVQSARRLADGRVLVANSGTSALLLFDSAGGFVRAIGRKGEGPGEFSGSMHIFRAPGDSLAVYDGGNLRWTFYDSELKLGRTALAVEAGIPRPTWLHNGAVVTNAALDNAWAWAGGIIDTVRAGDPGFDRLLEGRIDDQGDLWLREEGRWIVHSHDRGTGAVSVPAGLRLLQAGADFLLGVEKDSVDQDVLRLFPLERAAASGTAPLPAAVAPAPATDTAMIATMSTQLLMKQEMYYGDHSAYAPAADSLGVAFGNDVKLFVLWGDKRHWAAVTVRKTTGATCAVSVGWPAPAGWYDGTPFCGRE